MIPPKAENKRPLRDAGPETLLFIHGSGSQEQCAAVEEEVDQRVNMAKSDAASARYKLDRLQELQSRITGVEK